MSALPASLPSRSHSGVRVDRSAERVVFEACVGELPDLFTPREKEVARLVYLEGMTAVAAGRVIGSPGGSIGSALTRIRRILNRWLARKAAA